MAFPIHRPLLVAVVVVLTALGGCRDDENDDGSAGAEPLGAAEPARAPPPEVEPEGTVTDLGMDPEGMAYAPDVDVLAVATRDPNQLVLIQGSTGEELRRIALPGHARHLQMSGPAGPVIVPAEDSNTLLTVTLPGGEVRQTSVGEYPHDAAQSRSGRILVADELGGTLSVIEDGEVVHRFDDRQQPGGVAAVGRVVAVVDVGDFTLSTYDVDAERRVASVEAGSGPTHIAAVSGNRVAVVDTRGDALLVFGTDLLRLEERLDLPGTPYGVAYDDARDTLWITLTAANEVVGFDLSGTAPRETARFATVRQPNTVAVDPTSGRLWIAGRRTGELQVIDP